MTLESAVSDLTQASEALAEEFRQNVVGLDERLAQFDTDTQVKLTAFDNMELAKKAEFEAAKDLKIEQFEQDAQAALTALEEPAIVQNINDTLDGKIAEVDGKLAQADAAIAAIEENAVVQNIATTLDAKVAEVDAALQSVTQQHVVATTVTPNANGTINSVTETLANGAARETRYTYHPNGTVNTETVAMNDETVETKTFNYTDGVYVGFSLS